MLCKEGVVVLVPNNLCTYRNLKLMLSHTSFIRMSNRGYYVETLGDEQDIQMAVRKISFIPANLYLQGNRGADVVLMATGCGKC